MYKHTPTPNCVSDVDISPPSIGQSGKGGGISIHIKDSVLQALLERVPWSDVMDGLNNRLTRSEEIKHIKEHIYKTANDDTVYSRENWDNSNYLGLDPTKVQSQVGAWQSATLPSKATF